MVKIEPTEGHVLLCSSLKRQQVIDAQDYIQHPGLLKVTKYGSVMSVEFIIRPLSIYCNTHHIYLPLIYERTTLIARVLSIAENVRSYHAERLFETSSKTGQVSFCIHYTVLLYMHPSDHGSLLQQPVW